MARRGPLPRVAGAAAQRARVDCGCRAGADRGSPARHFRARRWARLRAARAYAGRAAARHVRRLADHHRAPPRLLGDPAGRSVQLALVPAGVCRVHRCDSGRVAASLRNSGGATRDSPSLRSCSGACSVSPSHSCCRGGLPLHLAAVRCRAGGRAAGSARNTDGVAVGRTGHSRTGHLATADQVVRSGADRRARCTSGRS